MDPNDKRSASITADDDPPQSVPISGEELALPIFIFHENSKGLCPFNFFKVFLIINASLMGLTFFYSECEFRVEALNADFVWISHFRHLNAGFMYLKLVFES